MSRKKQQPKHKIDQRPFGRLPYLVNCPADPTAFRTNPVRTVRIRMELASSTSITFDDVNTVIKARLRITAGTYVIRKFIFYGLDEVDKVKLIKVTESTTNMAFEDVGVVGKAKAHLAVAYPSSMQIVRELSQSSTAQLFTISGVEECYVLIDLWN